MLDDTSVRPSSRLSLRPLAHTPQSSSFAGMLAACALFCCAPPPQKESQDWPLGRFPCLSSGSGLTRKCWLGRYGWYSGSLHPAVATQRQVSGRPYVFPSTPMRACSNPSYAPKNKTKYLHIYHGRVAPPMLQPRRLPRKRPSPDQNRTEHPSS